MYIYHTIINIYLLGRPFGLIDGQSVTKYGCRVHQMSGRQGYETANL